MVPAAKRAVWLVVLFVLVWGIYELATYTREYDELDLALMRRRIRFYQKWAEYFGRCALEEETGYHRIVDSMRMN